MREKVRNARTRDFTPLTEFRLQWILDRITRTRVLVLGDYCLDIYWFVDSAMPYAPSDYERALFLRRWRTMGRLLVETLS